MIFLIWQASKHLSTSVHTSFAYFDHMTHSDGFVGDVSFCTSWSITCSCDFKIKLVKKTKTTHLISFTQLTFNLWSTHCKATLEHNAWSRLHKQSFVFTSFRRLKRCQWRKSRSRSPSSSFRELLQRLRAVTPLDPSCSLFCYGALQQRFHHFLLYSILYCHPGPESPWAKNWLLWSVLVPSVRLLSDTLESLHTTPLGCVHGMQWLGATINDSQFWAQKSLSPAFGPNRLSSGRNLGNKSETMKPCGWNKTRKNA